MYCPLADLILELNILSSLNIISPCYLVFSLARSTYILWHLSYLECLACLYMYYLNSGTVRFVAMFFRALKSCVSTSAGFLFSSDSFSFHDAARVPCCFLINSSSPISVVAYACSRLFHSRILLSGFTPRKVLFNVLLFRPRLPDWFYGGRESP